MINIDKKFYTPLSEFHPELQPNGRIVKCIEDLDNNYLKVTINDSMEPNVWIMKIKDLKEIKDE